MKKQSSLQNHSQTDARLDTAELRGEVLTSISLLLIVTTYIGWWQASGSLETNAELFVLFFLLFIAAISVFMLRRSHPKLASLLLMASLSIGLAAALYVLKQPAVQYLAVVPVIASYAISPTLGSTATVVNALILLILAGPNFNTLPALGLLSFTAVMEWLSQRRLDTVLQWSWSNQARVAQLLADLRERQGDLNRTLAALTEATRRLERTNRELAVARKEAEIARAFKEQFAANVSHELRTPLNLIVGFAEMMHLTPEIYEGVRWTPELEADIGEMYRASRHLQSLVNDVLDLSRIDARRLPMFRELVDLRSIIDDAGKVVYPLIKQRNLSYTVNYPQEMPDLLLDRTRIRQVMVNLLNNAARFTDKGGITVCVNVDEHQVTVSVHDTGTGIPESELGHVFEEYRQADANRAFGGAGLGLTISKQFITLHGGQMWVESKEGKGSVFNFTLPLPGSGSTPSLLEHIPSQTMVDRVDAPLVLVDPDPSIAEMMARYLGDVSVLPARDCAEAEKYVEIHHPWAIVVNEPPDAPQDSWLGILGETSRAYNVPILRCSIPSPSWLQRAIEIDGCLTKPVSRNDIAAVLREHCRKQEDKTILVVDDDRGFVAFMTRMLSTIDSTLKILSAYSGAEAIRLAGQAKPRLIFLDLIMPEIDGFEVARTLRQDSKLKNTLLIAVTATSYAEDVMFRHGAYLTLTQPEGLGAGILAELLRQIIRVVRPNYVEQETTVSRA